MEANEKRLRRTMIRIGAAMLIFLAILEILMGVWSIGSEIVSSIFDTVTANIINELSYAVVYLASFMVPALILHAMMGKDRTPMMLEKTLRPDAWAYILGGIAVTLTFAYLNSILVSIFNYSDFSSDVLWGNETLDNYQIVLSFITTAIVPAICEEFFFRGAILSALKPFGKAPSIIISAILFGLMHQNSEQLLYTTAAGLVIGWVVYETGSLWCGILMHFFNNFLSVIETVIVQRLPSLQANLVVFILECSIFALGIIGIVYVLSRSVKAKKADTSAREGMYGRSLAQLGIGECDCEISVPRGSITKHFFCPTMIIFIVLTALTMVLYIFMSILYSMGIIV